MLLQWIKHSSRNVFTSAVPENCDENQSQILQFLENGSVKVYRRHESPRHFFEIQPYPICQINQWDQSLYFENLRKKH